LSDIIGIHFDTNVLSSAASAPDARLQLRGVVDLARTVGLQVWYSPIVAIELLSGASSPEGRALQQTQERLRALTDTCGDSILCAPTDVLRNVARGRPRRTPYGDAQFAAIVRAAAEGDSHSIAKMGEHAAYVRRWLREDYVPRISLMQCHLSRLRTVEERVAFFQTRSWANTFYATVMAQSGATLDEIAATRETGMAAIDAHFTAFCRLGDVAARHPEFSPEKHANDNEDIQLLIYAASGLALITSEKKIVDRTATSHQADMVWHFEEARKRIEALRQ